MSGVDWKFPLRRRGSGGFLAAALLAGLLAIFVSKNGEADERPAFHTFVDTGFGFMDEDGFVLLYLGQGFSWKGFEVNLFGPLRFRVIDRSPGDDGVVREQDWDQYYEWARIARSLSFVREWDDAAVDLYFGELNGVGVGHGAVVDNYYNSTDMDHYQGGLLLKGELEGNGLELMLENALAPEILVGRAFVAPIAWFVEGEWPRRLEIGFTLGADIAAPYRVNGDGDTSIPVVGGDISFRVVDEEWLAVMPYFDLVGMDGELGVHAGLANTWTISESKGLALRLRGEYRYVGSDYHPAFFNPFYEYNRLYYEIDTPDETPTFADYLADADPPASHGLMFDAAFEWNRGLRIGARYDSEGRDRAHWVMFRIDLFPWDGYNVAAFYAGQDVNGGVDLFSLDSLIGIAMRGRIYGPIDLFAEFTRRWRRAGDDMGFANETGGGVGLSFTY
jgi:hypothetical protein